MTKAELLQNAKPILFNTETVRAILDGRKTVTRRVVKPQPPEDAEIEFCDGMEVAIDEKADLWNGRQCSYKPPFLPYRILTGRGDILYVRETHFCEPCTADCEGRFDESECPFNRVDDKCYGYKTQYAGGRCDGLKWRPSIHMPKEAARIFLRVTGVRVERLQEISPGDCLDEGVMNDICYACLCQVGECRPQRVEDVFCGGEEIITEKFADLWDSTIKKSELHIYGWEANPFCWVVEFERISI